MRRCWTSQLTSDRRRHGHRHTEALAEPCSALRLCCMQPSLISERLGRYLSVKMTKRNPAFVAAHQTEKQLKMEKARLMEGWKDSVDCWLSDVGKTKKNICLPSTEQNIKKSFLFAVSVRFLRSGKV